MKGKNKNLALIALLSAMTLSAGAAGVAAVQNEASSPLAVIAANAEETNVGAVQTTSTNVAQVGNTAYASIDEAIAAWTNNTTLTLMADVTLSDVVKLKSTEHHTLDLGTYTLTAASGKHAIEITCEGRSSASYALTVNADANNPGGITAKGKSCIYYSKSGSTKDRPIIRIYNGVFNGSYSINSKSNGNTNCTQIWIYGGTFNAYVNLTKNMLRVFGGTFNCSINCTGDSSAYREISGGKFKHWQFMTADADNKFWVGTSKANYDVGCYVDDEGYLVVGGAVITEAGDFEASSANYGGWSSYLKYSSAKTNGLYYTSVEEALADNNKTSGSVTVYVNKLDMTGIRYTGTIVVPEGKTLTITNAPANLKVTNTDGEAITPNANGTYSTTTPEGSITPAYTGATSIWGEGGGNASESLVVKLYSNDTLLATASLNNIDGIIDGDVYVSWNIPLNNAGNDEYWTVNWEKYITADTQPTRVEMWIDEVKVSENNARLNSPDDLNKIYAATADADGKFTQYYTSLKAAVAGAQSGDTVVVMKSIQNETITVEKNLTITGATATNARSASAVELTNVSISGSNDIELTVSNLTFAGNSWINTNGASKLTVSGVTADVTPSNTSATNSRSAFISLGRSEAATLELVVENSNIISRGGSNPILGWAQIKSATLTGNKFGSAEAYQTNSDSVKFMSIAKDAEFVITGNTVYSNYNGFVFGQNTTRNNAYTVTLENNTFIGGADHVWVEVSGSDTTHATINASSGNTVNGNAFTAGDIKVHPNIKKWTSYAGVGVVTDGNGKVIGGQLAYYAEDAIAEGYEIGADGTVKEKEVASVNGTSYASLEAAVAAATAGDEVVILKAGTYALPSFGKNITITGAVDGVVFDNIGAMNMGGASVMFNNVTFDYYPNVNYTGLQHSGDLAYNNCTFNGQLFLYGTSETFTNCTFNQTDVNNYNVWTYAAKTVTFDGCTFNSAGRSLLVYGDGGAAMTLTVEDTTFNASAPVDGKAAIEIDTSYTDGANITITNTTANNFGNGNVSGNSLWNNKKGNDANFEANNDITIVVDDTTVLAPKTLVANVGGKSYTSIEEAFKAATEGCTIEILADVVIDYKWDCRDYATNGSHSQFKESVTINGNGKTIKFTSTINDNNWNTVFRFEENATVNNLTIDISGATGAQRIITAKKSLTVDGLTIVGSARYGIIFGETDSAADLAATEIVIKNSTLTGTRRAISDNEGGKDVKSVVITGNTLNANAYASASESIVFNNNTAAGEVDLRSYTAENVLSVEAKGNTLNTAVKNYIYAKTIDAQTEFATKRPAIKVATKAELNAAIAEAKDGDTITLTADIDYGTDQLAIAKAITLDLGGKKLTTRNAWGGMSIKGNATVKNGTIVHASNTAAIKVWNATAFEDLVIDVQGKGDANKTIGGIVLQSGSTTRVGSIKNVTIKGVALTNGIETYNCGDATENVIGSMENVTIDAKGTGMLISAPCGTATNCTINGDVNGIEIWIKGNYSASLNLVDCDVEGGVYAHDEFTSNPDAVNNGTLKLTADEATTGADVTLELARAENVDGLLQEIKESAQAKLNNTYYATLAEAVAAAKAGDTVTIFAGTYAMPAMKAGITVVGEGNVLLEGTLTGTLENLTLKNLHIKGASAQRWAYAKGNLVFENVTFEATSVYAIHFDGITADATLTYTDCTIIGWAAMGGSPASCVFEGCTFKGNGTYGLIRTYFNATITNCTFDVANVNTNDQYQDGIHAVEGAKVTVTGCTNVNGSMADLVNVHANSVVELDGVEIKNVAKIGNAYYATFAEAFKNAENGATIILNKDIVIDSETYTIADGKSLTLDMNGKKITVADNKTGNYELFYIYGEMTVTGNGTIELTATNDRDWNASSSIFHNRGGVLTIENGTYTNCGGTDMAYVVDNSGNWYGDATTNINGGALTSSYIAIRNRMEQNTHGASGKAILNVSGGTISGTKRAIWAQAASTSTASPATGEINITGGEIGLISTAVSEGAVSMTTISGGTVAEFVGEIAELTVNGGTLEAVELLKANGNAVAAYAITADGLYVEAAAKIGTVGYATFAEALAAAQAGATIDLLADVTASEVILIGKNVTINGNNHNVTSSATRVFRVTNSNVVVELNNVNMVSNTEMVYPNDIRGISVDAYLSNVTLTLNNCSVDFTDASACDWAYAVNVSGNGTGHKVTVNGGTYEGANVINVHGANNTVVVKDATLNCLYPDSMGYAGACIWVLQNQGSSVEATGNTFNGSNAVAFNLGTGTGLTESNNTDNTKMVVAAIGKTYYTSIDEAITAAVEGETVKIKAGTYDRGLTVNKAGITVEAQGEVNFNGKLSINANGVTVKGLNFTNSGTAAYVGAKNVVIEDCTLTGSNGLYQSYTSGLVTFKNSTITGATYGIHFDGNAGGEIVIEGCTITGWTSFASTITKVTMKGTTFAEGGYNYVRFYQSATIEGCTFNEKMGVDLKVAGSTLTVNNSTLENGNIENLFSGNDMVESTIIVDGKTLVREAKVGNTYYETLAEAMAAANDATITLLADVVLEDTLTIAAGKTIKLDLNGKTISQSKACTASYEMINNKGNLTITGNGKISFTDTSAGDPTYGWGSYTVRNEGTLVVENGTIEHMGAQTQHMYCAIFQYCGSTTINGGTISTPNYRSVRLWKGEMEINGGTFNGQVWVQAVDSTSDLTINGGTFAPAGGDASAVFVTNSTYDVEFAVTGGTFNGKIGTSDANALAGAITGGLFNEAAVTNTNVALLGNGFVFGNEANANGYYGIIKAVAMVGENGYATFIEALTAAIESSASEIVVLQDIREKMTNDFELVLNADLTITAEKPVKVEFYNEGTRYDFVVGSNNNNTLTIAENVHFDLEDRVIWLGYYGNNVDVVVKGYLGGNQIWHGADTTVTGTIDSHGEAFIMRRDATLTVNGGTVKANYFQIYSGHINAKDATITAGLVWVNNNHSHGVEGTVSFALDNTSFNSKGEMKMYAGEGKALNFTLTNGASVSATSLTVGDGVSIVGDLSSTFVVANKSVFVATAGDMQYTSLAEAVAAANDATITLLADVVLEDTLTIAAGKTITLDLNGKTINVAYEAGSTTKHIYAFENYGDLTITGNGTINARGIFNYGKLTLENGTINSIDGNGGYAVRSYEGTFTMNGGVVATTYEDGDVPGEGYDASPIRIDEGATFIMNGGELKNVSNYTCALDNYGTATIKNGKMTSVHTTIANHGTLTIKDGEFTCNGLEGITAHVVWAAEGTTTINGGTFNGKDNYNGFNVDASAGATVVITGGTFQNVHSGSLYGEGTITVSGGNFFDKIPEARCADGYIPTTNADGSYDVVKTTVRIGSVEDLMAFANAVTNNQKYQGVKVAANSNAVVRLTANLDLSNSGFVGIGDGSANTFCGTFDGQNYTISNMTLTCNYRRGVGFFRSLGKGAVVKNVTFVNANVNNGAATSANHFYGVVAGFSNNVTLDNVYVKDSTVTCKYSGAALVGCLEGDTLIKNSVIENVTLTTTNIRAAAYGVIGNSATGHVLTTENNTIKNTKLILNGETKPLPEAVDYGSLENDSIGAAYIASVQNNLTHYCIYTTIADAYEAAQAGETITLLEDVTMSEALVINKSITINGNGNTLTSTASRAINVDTANGTVTTTIKNLEIVGGKGCQRGINIIDNAYKGTPANVTLDNVKISGVSTYGVQLAGSVGSNNTITITNSTISSWIALNINGDSQTVTIENSHLSGTAYSAVDKGNTITLSATNTIVTMTGGSLSAATSEGLVNHHCGHVAGAGSNIVLTGVETSVANVGDEVIRYAVATIAGKDGSYMSLADAIEKAQAGETITLLKGVVVKAGETLTIDKDVNIVYTSNVAGEDMITVRGTLNISAGKLTYVNTDTTASNVTVSTISCEPGSVLNVTGGTIENKTVKADGSSIYSYAIDMLTNGSLGDVTVNIEGGTVYSDYMAIRQFNNSEACKNTLTISGGEIYGAKRAIQVHLKNNMAYTTISGGTIKAGDYALCIFPTVSGALSVTGGNFIGTIYSGTEGFISGGTFDQELYAGYCAKGFTAKQQADGSYSVMKAAEVKLYAANLTVGVDLSMNFYVQSEEDLSNEVMIFSIDDLYDDAGALTSSSEATLVDLDGVQVYKFTFKGVGPHMMGRTITATLGASTFEYSIKDYALEQFNMTDAELIDALKISNEQWKEEKLHVYRTFLANLLEYGAQSQVYAAKKAGTTLEAVKDTLVTAGLSKKILSLVTHYHAVEPNDYKDFKPEGVTVAKTIIFGSTNKIRILFQAGENGVDNATKFDGWTAKIYGPGHRGTVAKLAFDEMYSTTDSEYWFIEISGIRATEYDNNYDIFLRDKDDKAVKGYYKDEQGTVHEEDAVISYSVQKYVKNTQETIKDAAPLTVALWNYYHAAEDYIDEFVK